MTLKQEQLPSVSQREYDRTVERQGWAIRSEDRGSSSRIRLYDVVTKDWAKPLEEGLVYQYFIKKVCFLCSACGYVTVFDGGVVQHHERVLEQVRTHETASMRRIEGLEETIDRCSGCESEFRLRKMQGQKHLERIKTEGLAHKGKVESLTVQQYALVPSEPVVLGRTLIADGVEAPPNGHGPVARGEGMPRRRKRRGRRGRSRDGR